MSTGWVEQRVSHWFVTGWAEQFAEALRSADAEGKLAHLTLTPAEPHPDAWEAWKDPVWCSVKTEAPDGVALFIGCAHDTVKGLTRGIAGSEDAPAQSGSRAHHGLVRQSLVALVSRIEEQTGKQVEFGEAKESIPPADGTLGVEYQVNLGGVVHLLALVPSQELVDTLLSVVPAMRAEAEMPNDSIEEPEENSPAVPVEQGASVADNLNVLLDVDLDLSVSFGKAELLLEDVLTLASGSIVELNRSANDPVDVLVNNSIVARGEVVVVDGNYGIRVTEVVSRKERIRSVM